MLLEANHKHSVNPHRNRHDEDFSLMPVDEFILKLREKGVLALAHGLHVVRMLRMLFVAVELR